MPPGLVVVSGYPAAGKSTLSKRLADELGFVFVSRDRMKPPMEPVLEALPDDAPMRVVGRTLDRLINHVIESVFDAGHGVVVDSNFNWPEQRTPIRTLVADREPPTFEICLWGDRDVLRQRFIDRAEPPMTPELDVIHAQAISRPREPVLGPPTPIVELDTTNLSVLGLAYPAIVTEIRDHFNGGTASVSGNGRRLGLELP